MTGSLGGPLELGRVGATANVAADQVSVVTRSGSGSKVTTANLTSEGKPGESRFTYKGETVRGPASVAMILAGGRVSRADVSISRQSRAVRVPVTDAHKAGVGIRPR